MDREVSPVIAYTIIIGAVFAIIGTFVFGLGLPTIAGAVVGVLLGFVLGDIVRKNSKGN